MSSQTLYVELKKLDRDWIQLRYRLDTEKWFEPQNLHVETIRALIDQGELEYYVVRPNLQEVGRRLYDWLDGDGRWLSQAIKKCHRRGLVLAIAADAKLAHLPWEVLHDGTSFLIESKNPAIVPVRWIDEPAELPPPQARSLHILFMATSPDNVKPVLNYEQEEAAIIGVSRDLPLTLRVEESGCVEHLGKLWQFYPEHTFDILHLTGHAGHKDDGTPIFLTESLTGERLDSTADELWDAFNYRLPRLVFLSGCRTGQAPQAGKAASMAEELVRLGTPAVLSWGRPVLDTTATAAAEALYRQLSAGTEIALALADAYRVLLTERKAKDWHLLRLYATDGAWQALVEPTGDYYQAPEPVHLQFLDPDNNVRVATPEQFVGRRKLLQRSLKALRDGRHLGVVLYGMGGNGKSTTAARLLERMPDYQALVIYRGFDAENLERLLAQQCTNKAGHDILNEGLPTMQRWRKFLSDGLNEPKQKFCFVLDDFEANLDIDEHGRHQIDSQDKVKLKADVVPCLNDLLNAIAGSGKTHRVIVTSRYDFTVPDPSLNRRLHRELVESLKDADLYKKYDRLISFNTQSAINPKLQETAKALADGNSRLLEWLNELLQALDGGNTVELEPIFVRMADKAAEFRETILAEALLAQQPEACRQLLNRLLLFDLPVPQAAVTALCGDLDGLAKLQQRMQALGLLEASISDGDTLYRVPRILSGLLTQEPTPAQLGAAAETLYRLWWLDAEQPTESRQREIHRLALRAHKPEIAVEMADNLGKFWLKNYRTGEARALYEQTLELAGLDYRLLGGLARALLHQGDGDGAEQRFNQALQTCPDSNTKERIFLSHHLAELLTRRGELDQALHILQGELLPLVRQQQDDREIAVTLGQIADILYARGDPDAALKIRQDEQLPVFERLGDLCARAVALGKIADIFFGRGDLDAALKIHQDEELPVYERLDDVRSRAVTLGKIADILFARGDLDAALKIRQDEQLPVLERLDDVRARAVALGKIADILFARDDPDAALKILQNELLPVFERLGDVRARAVTIGRIADILFAWGDLDAALKIRQNEELPVYERLGDVREKSACLFKIARIYLQKEDFEPAFAHLHAAYEIVMKLGELTGIVYVGMELAPFYWYGGDKEQGLELWQRSLDGLRKLQRTEEADALQAMIDRLLAEAAD